MTRYSISDIKQQCKSPNVFEDATELLPLLKRMIVSVTGHRDELEVILKSVTTTEPVTVTVVGGCLNCSCCAGESTWCEHSALIALGLLRKQLGSVDKEQHTLFVKLRRAFRRYHVEPSHVADTLLVPQAPHTRTVGQGNLVFITTASQKLSVLRGKVACFMCDECEDSRVDGRRVPCKCVLSLFLHSFGLHPVVAEMTETSLYSAETTRM